MKRRERSPAVGFLACFLSLLATAFVNRADVRQVDLLVKASPSDITVARSGYFPSIDATGRYDGYETEGELVEARARYRELQASLNDIFEHNDAQSNLVTTYSAYLTALARIENATGPTRGLTVSPL